MMVPGAADPAFIDKHAGNDDKKLVITTKRERENARVWYYFPTTIPPMQLGCWMG
jgi:hypothetical protein